MGGSGDFIDKTNHGKSIHLEFNGSMRDEQPLAIDKLLKYDNGILSGTTAFGKTVVAIKLITRKGKYTFYNAGYQAGKYVGEMDSGNFIIPEYFILDPEGYNTAASTASEWSDFLNGWADGLNVYSLKSLAAFYCNQSQYTTYNLGTIGLPAFIAVSPILNNTPSVQGGNVNGYASYYAYCPATNYVNQVAGWGGTYSTVQFSDSGVDCAP